MNTRSPKKKKNNEAIRGCCKDPVILGLGAVDPVLHCSTLGCLRCCFLKIVEVISGSKGAEVRSTCELGKLF